MVRTRLAFASAALALALVACGSSNNHGTGGHGTGGHGTGGHGTTSSGSTGTGGGMPACGTDAWATYGHDARRTSASDGCIQGALATAWRYAPTAPSGKKVNAVFNAIAQSDAAFLQWSASDDPYLGTTAADRVDGSGSRVWTWDSGTDSNVGNWPTLAFGQLVLDDDGIYYLDAGSGMKTQGTGVDYWGQTAFDGTRLYAINASHVDGPGIFAGAFDAQAKQLWSANPYGMCRIDAGDIANGIAVDGGSLFYAPSYAPGTGVMLPFASGVYAFDPATGKQTWFQVTTPASGISAGGGLLYLIEESAGGDQLVARKQSDGTVAWTAAVTGAGTQAPVIAAGKVIVGAQAGVLAFDATTGKDAWTAMVNGAAADAIALQFSGGCVNGSAQWSGSNFGSPVATTTMAAALGSSTLVVTAFDGVHVLSLASGAEAWQGMPAQAMGAVRNPVIVGDTVYVVDGGGLMALKAQ